MVDILDNFRVATYKHFGCEAQEDKIIEESMEFLDEVRKNHAGADNADAYLEEQADLYNVLRQKYLSNDLLREYSDKKMIRTIKRYDINVD